MRFFVLIFLSLSAMSHANTNFNCDAEDTKASLAAAKFHPPETHYVVGSGRLYFHSAPVIVCKDKNLFVVPGDYLYVYSEYADWYQVMFVNPKTGKEAEGWVQKNRLKYQGTLAPRQ